MLVDSRDHEVQGQLQWLSIRIREGRICRNSQAYGQWVLHRVTGSVGVIWGELNG